MKSRHQKQEEASQFVSIQDIPEQLRWKVIDFLSCHYNELSDSKSQVILALYNCEEVQELFDLQQDQLALVFRSSTSLIQKVLQELRAGKPDRPRGRPGILSDESIDQITDWLRDRTDRKDWVTTREFKGRVVNILEAQGVEDFPTNQFYRDLLTRIDQGRYVTVPAVPLEEDRFQVTPQQILEYYEYLREISLENLDPNLIVNLDETGFGASRSHRMRPVKVIAPKDMSTRPCVKQEPDKVFVSAIAAITAAGNSLSPALVVRRQSLTPDFQTIPFRGEAHIYQTEKAFVTTNVFNDYIREVVVEHILQWRSEHNMDEAQGVIIFDGHSSHLNSTLNAFCATQNIRLVCIPPHASHILQPLDRLYFSHLKQVYAGIKTTAMLSKLSKTLLKVWIAFEASNVSYYICQSWRMTGINPVVEENKVVRVELHPESLDGSPSLQHNFDGNERARGQPTRKPRWGLLNDDEILLADAGQCPFCCGPLPPDWEWP